MYKGIFKNVLSTILIIFFCTSISIISIEAQEFNRITEKSNEVDLSPQLRSILQSDSGDIESKILSWYSNQGYLNASVTRIDELSYDVNKGCQFYLRAIEIKNPSFSEWSLRELGFYSEKLFQFHIHQLLGKLNENGYVFAKIEVTKFLPNVNACEVTAQLEIYEGKQWFTSGILFPGAKVNEDEYLKKIIGFQDSVLLTSTLLGDFKEKLVRSDLFDAVSNPEVFVDKNESVIIVAVEERVLNRFDGLLGYVPDQNGDGQIVGDVELSLWNVLNQGNRVDLEYQRLKPETSRLNIGISQDWFGTLPLYLGFNFNLFQNDTTYQTRNVSVESYYSISPRLKITSQIGQLSSTAGSNPLSFIEPKGKKQFAEFGFRYSSLNNVDVPLSGFLLDVRLGVSNKSVDIDSIGVFSQRYIQSNLGMYIPIFEKSVLAFSSQSFFVASNEFTDSDLIRFGGANSFRGYSEEQFRASQLVWGDVEYRFLVNRYSYLFAFGAVGYYERPKLLTEIDNGFKTTDRLISTGFGLSYKIKIGRLKFTYAISPNESIGNGKVHVGIVTQL